MENIGQIRKSENKPRTHLGNKNLNIFLVNNITYTVSDTCLSKCGIVAFFGFLWGFDLLPFCGILQSNKLIMRINTKGDHHCYINTGKALYDIFIVLMSLILVMSVCLCLLRNHYFPSSNVCIFHSQVYLLLLLLF